MVRKAVIPAAGFGTRFLPATKSQPKEMLSIVDTPVIQYVVEEATRSVESNTPSKLLDGALARDALILGHKQTQSIVERKTVEI